MAELSDLKQQLDSIEKLLRQEPSRLERLLQVTKDVVVPLIGTCFVLVVGIAANQIATSQVALSDKIAQAQLALTREGEANRKAQADSAFELKPLRSSYRILRRTTLGNRRSLSSV